MGLMLILMLKNRFAALDTPSWGHKPDFELSALKGLNSNVCPRLFR